MRFLLLIPAVLILTVSPCLAQFTWVAKASFGGGAITEARAFSIGNNGYFCGPTSVLWKYDPSANSWSQMAAFPGPTRLSPVAFSIGSKGYMGTGNALNDFWEYDEPTNMWTQKANFGGSGREGALGIAIDGKGYVGTGGNYLADWWEYNPATNSWTQKANLAGPGRYHGGAFTIGTKGYVCTGFNGSFFNDLWEYDPVLNSWTARASMPTVTRDRPVGLATATKGYIITGWTGSMALNDAWEYDPVGDSWTQLPSMPTAGRYNSCGFTIANKLFIGTGYMNGTTADFWSYGPDCITQTSSVATTCNNTCDGSATVTSPSPGAVTSYLWSTGATTPDILGLCSGSYTVTVTDTTGCASTSTIVVNAPPALTATAVITEPTCAGDTDGVLCAIPNTTPVTYLWANMDTTDCISNIPAGNYTVTITDSSGCSNTITLSLTEPAAININFSVTNATCSTCANGSAFAQTTGGTPPLTYQWSTGSTLAFISSQLPGIYSCCVTDANGCIQCDTVEILYPVGINELNGEYFSVSPNPFSDIITVKGKDVRKIEIYDLTGKTILSMDGIYPEEKIIDTGLLKNGTYFIFIEHQYGYIRKYKLIKSH